MRVRTRPVALLLSGLTLMTACLQPFAWSEDRINFYNGQVVYGHLVDFSGDLIRYRTGLTDRLSTTRMRLSDRNDVVIMRDNSRLLGEVHYMDGAKLEVVTPTGTQTVWRALVKDVELGSRVGGAPMQVSGSPMQVADARDPGATRVSQHDQFSYYHPSFRPNRFSDAQAAPMASDRPSQQTARERVKTNTADCADFPYDPNGGILRQGKNRGRTEYQLPGDVVVMRGNTCPSPPASSSTNTESWPADDIQPRPALGTMQSSPPQLPSERARTVSSSGPPSGGNSGKPLVVFPNP